MPREKPGRRGPILGMTLLSCALLVPGGAAACSSCGCILGSDWAAQGYSAGAGFRLDVREDYFNQDQLRTGTGKFDRGGVTLPTDREVQQKTVNRNLTVALDYSPNADWGVTVLVPYFDRFHSSIINGDTELSASHTRSPGDIRVLGRYQGFSGDRSTGIQAGLKLASGAFHNTFIDGPQAGQPLDRGLQPGTGTTDLLLGAYHFGTLNRDWDYFSQAIVQLPLNSREDFRPGAGLNLNVGVRYFVSETVTPHVQINARIEKRESGANADVANSGATLVNLSPGLTVRVTKDASIYGYVQVPIYQRVNGLQLESGYTLSLGVRYGF